MKVQSLPAQCLLPDPAGPLTTGTEPLQLLGQQSLALK